MKEDYIYTYQNHNTNDYIHKVLPQIVDLSVNTMDIKKLIMKTIYEDLLEVQRVPVGPKRGRYMIMDNPYNASILHARLNGHQNTIRRIRVAKKTRPFVIEAKRIIDKRYKKLDDIENDIDYTLGYINLRHFIPFGEWMDKGLEVKGKTVYLSLFYILGIIKEVSEYITIEYLPKLQEKAYWYAGAKKNKRCPVRIWHRAF